MRVRKGDGRRLDGKGAYELKTSPVTAKLMGAELQRQPNIFGCAGGLAEAVRSD
jgi:hypothetical protein